MRSAILFLSAAAFLPSTLAPLASAQDAVTSQIKAQYKLVKLAPDSSGLAVIDPGIVLVIQKGGLLGIPPTNVVSCAAKFQDGELHAAGGFCAAMVKDVSRFFQVGEKVYPWKIDVNVKKEQISFKVVACDSCNGTNPPTFYKSEVSFQFPKGYLETAQAGQVQQAIAQVFSIDGGDAQAAQPAQAPAPASDPPPPAPVAEAPPPPIAPPPPPADQPPATIEVGQTIDQVVAILGQPQKIVKLAAKQIYVFKDLKVTFDKGKVSDVQ
jgi:hypothetical protein